MQPFPPPPFLPCTTNSGTLFPAPSHRGSQGTLARQPIDLAGSILFFSDACQSDSIAQDASEQGLINDTELVLCAHRRATYRKTQLERFLLYLLATQEMSTVSPCQTHLQPRSWPTVEGTALLSALLRSFPFSANTNRTRSWPMTHAARVAWNVTTAALRTIPYRV